MDEAQFSEPNGSRRSFGGMFSGILSKQVSMDTDTSDRLRRGGKVKPGQGSKHLLARNSSSSGGGDVHVAPESPSSALSGSCPSADWVAAGQDAAMSHYWPGTSPQLHTTPSRGLFSKLLSKKKKQSTDPSAAYSSPSLGASSRGSESPSSHSVEQLSMLPDTDVLPITPPYKHRSASDDAAAAFGSVYSTPADSDAMHSANLQCQEIYGGDTLDFRQMVPQDITGVLTPGFSQLLEAAGGRSHEPNSPQQTPGDDRTVMLVSGAQLAQAGRVYDVPAMLLGPQAEEIGSTVIVPSPRNEGNSSVAELEGSSAATQQTPAEEVDDAGFIAPAGLLTDANVGTGFEEHDQRLLAMQQAPAAVQDVQLVITGNTASLVPLGNSEASATTADMAAAADHSQTQEAVSAMDETLTAAAEPVTVCEAADREVPQAAEQEMNQLSAGSDSDLESEHSQPDASEQQAMAVGAAWPELEPSVQEVGAPAQPVEESPFLPAGQSPATDMKASEEPIVPAVVESVGVPSALVDASDLIASSPAEPAAQLLAANTSVLVSDTAPAGTRLVPAVDTNRVPEAVTNSPADEPTATATSAAAVSGVVALASAKAATEPTAPCQGQEVMHPTPLAANHVQQQQQPDCCDAADPSSSANASLPASPVQLGVDSSEVLLQQQRHEAATAAVAGAEEERFDTLPVNTERSDASPQSAAESSYAALQPQMSGSISDTEAAVVLPMPDSDDACSEQEFEQPDSLLASAPEATAEPAGLADSGSPPQPSAAPNPLQFSNARKSRQSPLHLVRESMPLFVADPGRAMGRPLALEEEGLDDQDLQQIISNRLAQHAAASHRPTLLAHGGPQRVAMGQFGGVLPSSLEPVAEASYSSAGSPIPEGSPSPVGSLGSGSFRTSLNLPGDMSPMRPCQLGSHLPMDPPTQATPAAGSTGARSPNLAVTPGSVYSTPTMAFNGKTSIQQACTTPQTGFTDVSVGSAIRQVTPAQVGVADLSPAILDLPEASPTLMLMPGGPGLIDTPVNLQGTSDGTTPSLLDARAASPSAVYATRFMATPFRGALAALPVDAALAAPLVDSSPFQLSDCGMDTVCLADEAQRVAANLAMAAGGFAATPVRTPAVTSKASAASPASAASQGRSAAGAGSPTEELRDLHVVMLTKQLAEVQKKVKDLEAENLRLKEQVEIYEFEKTELNSQEEMEKQARQYAEEQLEDMRVEMQRLLQAKNAQAQQIINLQQEYGVKQEEAQRQFDTLQQERARLAHTIAQLQDERNQVLDKLNLVDMQVTALKSSNADLSAAVEAEQQRCSELEAVVASQDRDLAEAGRCSLESQARLEKMMEQMIAANTAKEHARQKAADEAVKVQQLLAEQQTWQEDRKKYAALKQKYSQKSALLKELEQKVQAKDAENQELMSMCDQLLQQQEGRR